MKLKILITPMAAVAETDGSMTRTRAIAIKARHKGHEVALCAGEDINYRPIEGIINYYAPIPSPFSLPGFAGRKVFHVAKLAGIQQRITISDFEQVLYFIGALEGKYFSHDVHCVREAIQKFKPDIVVTEHRLSPLVAATLENVKTAAVYSAPIDKSRHVINYGRHSDAVNKFVKNNGLPPIRSALDLYDWASLKLIPSSPELEPLADNDLVYVGALMENAKPKNNLPGNNIVAYMGNGTVSARKLVNVLAKAFKNTKYTVFIATKEIAPFDNENIHVASRFDFNELLSSATMFISHGGQNSMVQSLMNSVPLLVCPGKIFERRYNAESVVKIGAGKLVDVKDFTPQSIVSICKEFENDLSCRQKAFDAGRKLYELGGVDKAIEALETIITPAIGIAL